MADFGRITRAAAPGMSRLAMAIAGGPGGAYQRAYDNQLGLQSKLAQALAGMEADYATADYRRAEAKKTDTERGIIEGRGGVGDELLASAASTDLPTLRAWRNRLQGTPQGSATGFPEMDELIGVTADPQVDSRVAAELARMAPRFAAFRTSTGDLKADDLAKATGEYRNQDLSDAIIAGRANRNTVAGAQAAAGGKDLYSSDSTGAVLDRFQGNLDTANPMAGSTIRLRGEQAGQARAAAAENYAQADNARASAARTREEMNRGRGGDIVQVVRPDGAVWLVNKTTGQSKPVVDADGNAVISGKAGGSGTGAGKPLTEGQAKANLFGNRMLESDRVLREMEERGVYRPGNMKAMAEGVAGAVPLIGDSLKEGASALTNWTQSDEQQAVEQARRDFINAVLRRESGAVISDAEFVNADKQYFPQLGDSKEVREQKRRNRERVTKLMLDEVPEHHRRKPEAASPPQQPPKQQPGGATGSWGDAPAGWSIRKVP